MGDMGDVFRAMKAASQKKRASNRDNAIPLLSNANIEYESKSNGTHLIIEGRIDFWPGTGLWIVRDTNMRRRGIRKLIAYLER